VSNADLEELLKVDADGWKAALPQIKDHYAQFGPKLPAKLSAQLDSLAAAL
jgi:phosphoenolpyruvate carboxykinase (GTP)